MITMEQAAQFAKEGNVNGVAAFINQERDSGSGVSYIAIDILKETLMNAYISGISEVGEDEFSDIRRIANL